MSLETLKMDTRDRFIELFNENQELLKLDSPEYINILREKALEQFKKPGIPDKKNEQ